MSSHADILNAAKKASEVIEDFNMRKRIEDGYTRIDPALIASYSNVTLMYKRLDKLLGSFLRIDDRAGIIVNYDRPKGLVHMTCAHELGHYFLGHESNSDVTIDYGLNAEDLEQCANFFAYSLLAPRWLIVKIMREKKWVRQDFAKPIIIYQLSLRLGISYSAMIWSLFALKLIDDQTRKNLHKIQPKQIKQTIASDKNLQIGNQDVWLLSASDKDQILEPAIGDKYIFDLPNHAGSGHLWEIDDAISKGFHISPFTVNMETNKKASLDESIVIGGKGNLKYSLEVPNNIALDDSMYLAQRCRQQIALVETKTWSTENPINEFSLYSEYELINNGFSTQEQEKRLASIEPHK